MHIILGLFLSFTLTFSPLFGELSCSKTPYEVGYMFMGSSIYFSLPNSSGEIIKIKDGTGHLFMNLGIPHLLEKKDIPNRKRFVNSLAVSVDSFASHLVTSGKVNSPHHSLIVLLKDLNKLIRSLEDARDQKIHKKIVDKWALFKSELSTYDNGDVAAGLGLYSSHDETGSGTQLTDLLFHCGAKITSFNIMKPADFGILTLPKKGRKKRSRSGKKLE